MDVSDTPPHAATADQGPGGTAPGAGEDAGGGDSPEGPGVRTWVVAVAASAAVVLAAGFLMTRGGSEDTGAPIAATSELDDGSTQPGAAGAPNAPGARPGGSGVAGEVTAVGDEVLTLEATGPNGEASEVEVLLTGDTAVSEIAPGSLEDLEVGDTVAVTGDSSDDGALAAAVITETELAPAGAPGGGAPAAGMQPPDGVEPPDGLEVPEGLETPDGSELPDGAELPDGSQLPDGAPVPGGIPNGADTGRVIGEITSIDGSVVTLTTADGSQVEVATNDGTEVNVSLERTLQDIGVGDSVRVTGAEVDGSVDAERVVIGDVAGFGGVGGGPGAAGVRPGAATRGTD